MRERPARVEASSQEGPRACQGTMKTEQRHGDMMEKSIRLDSLLYLIPSRVNPPCLDKTAGLMGHVGTSSATKRKMKARIPIFAFPPSPLSPLCPANLARHPSSVICVLPQSP